MVLNTSIGMYRWRGAFKHDLATNALVGNNVLALLAQTVDAKLDHLTRF